MFSVRFLVALAIHGRVFAVDVSHPDASPGHMEATILAEGESQIRSVVRKENVSAENDEGKSCKCTEVDLKGKKWSPGGLQKCVGSCTDVRKSTSKNDCPKHWKIISPRNEEDWKTLIDLDVLKEVAAPHLLVDVTQPKNGPGGDRSHPMNSGEKGRSMWVTIDGSEWWLRDKVFHEPSGDYHANCFLHIFRFSNPSDIQFNDASCAAHSHRYLCQPDIRHTTTTTTTEPGKGSAKRSAVLHSMVWALGFIWMRLSA
mmetsp:Transcript_126494/g.300415  ORF Transcript_126494/g.300415 Transcript_126494/m.300415 type:complete len:257 (+) Transcript_126494:84-854(+)